MTDRPNCNRGRDGDDRDRDRDDQRNGIDGKLEGVSGLGCVSNVDLSEHLSEMPEMSEMSEEGLNRLLVDLLDTDEHGNKINRPIPVVQRVTIDEFHEMMGRAVKARRVTCMPTTLMEETEVFDSVDPQGESTLLFNARPMVAMLFSPTLSGRNETVIVVDPDVAIMFASQLRIIAAMALDPEGQEGSQ